MTTNLMECRACGIGSEAAAKCPVCGTADTTGLDELTRTVTAFTTWGEFCGAMAGGHCPTLRVADRKRKSACQQKFDAAVTQLAAAVRAAGFPVFDGSRVA